MIFRCTRKAIFGRNKANSNAILQTTGQIPSGKLCTSLRTCTQEKGTLQSVERGLLSASDQEEESM